MNKPWEETWTADEDSGGWHIGPQPDGRCTMFRNSDPATHDRQSDVARVITCAPEAIRMLMAKEWSPDTIAGQEPYCEECNAPRWLGQHAPACRWLALMRKAGVRE